MRKSKYLILCLVFISFCSCRVAKKSWVKETYAEKTEVTSLKESFANSKETLKTEISETLSLEFSEKLKQGTTKESESTTVTGTIEAEDGKEKSVTIGGTTITSNGANISFETNSSKEIATQYKELSSQLATERNLTQELQTELISLKSEFADFRSTYESDKTTKTKDVTKRGGTFGVWIFGIIALVVIFLLWYFRKMLPF